jgi:L-ribulose-5-phosphate 3-epimerase
VTHLRIAVRTACLPLAPREAIHAAGQMGAAGVQLDAVGELAPSQLSETGRRDLLRVLRGYELEVASLASSTVALAGPDTFDAALAELGALFALSRALGGGIVTVAAGRLPDSPENPLWESMHEGVKALADLASHFGAVAALAAGADSADVMARFLDELDTDSLGVNVHPAGFLANSHDPIEATRRLGERIVHTQIRDARRAGPLAHAEETRVGEGQIDWAEWLAALAGVDYSGWLTLQTGLGDDPVAHLGAAVEFLRRF